MPATILIVTDGFPPVYGGGSSSCARVTRILSSLGYTCLVAVFPEGQQGASGPEGPRVRETATPWVKVFWHASPSHWSDEVFGAWVSSSLAQIVSKHDVTALQIFYVGRLTISAVLTAKRHGIPCISSFRGSDIYRDPMARSGLERVRCAAEYSDLLTTVNQESCDILKRLFPQASNKVIVIRNSISGCAHAFWNRHRHCAKAQITNGENTCLIGVIGATS